MRITGNMMINDLQRNLSNSMRKIQEYENQLSTGRKINKPSDDPAGLVRAQRLNTSLDEGDQYLDNINNGIDLMSTTDSALNSIDEVMLRVRDLTVEAANGTNDSSAEDSIAAEIKQLNEQLKTIANSTYGSKYIFAGTNVTEAPYQENGWTGNDDEINVEIGVGVTMPINLKTREFFIGSTDPVTKDVYPDAIKINDADISQMGGNDLQCGNYTIDTAILSGSVSAQAEALDCYSQQGETSIISVGSGVGGAQNVNASIELTVSNIASGNVTYTYRAHEINTSGVAGYCSGTFTLSGTGAQTVSISGSGCTAITLSLQVPTDTGSLSAGDRQVLGVTAAASGSGYCSMNVNNTAAGSSGAASNYNFVLEQSAVSGATTQLKFYSEDNYGNSYDSTVSMKIANIGNDSSAATINVKKGIFNLMDELAGNVENAEAAGSNSTANAKTNLQTNLSEIDSKVDDLLTTRATLGAKINRLQFQQSRLETTQTSSTSLLADTEDADVAEVITSYKEQENVYQAALAVGANIIQRSLVDFLK